MNGITNLNENTVVGVLGLGYVGLPVALEFSKKYLTWGFDISNERVQALQQGEDDTGEIDTRDLENATRFHATDSLEDLRRCDVYIVTVPTPVDQNNDPDLSLLKLASRSVGLVIQRSNVVVFESTVFPGATEEVCLPLIEAESGLQLNDDFFAGYSPERINPGDQTHRLTSVVKVTSGSCSQAADFVDELYASIIPAGTHRASSIRVAEAAKVIENIQRDINIALVNEFSEVFERLNLDTNEVLEVAGTKWNFLPFKPGLVGGHCIGVDPYYLTHKAISVDYTPEVILAGRRINNDMPYRVANRVLKLMQTSDKEIRGAQVLVMGLTFKENCPDTRNSKSFDLIQSFKELEMNVDVYDPLVAAKNNLGVNLIDKPAIDHYDAIIIAVAHDQFLEFGIEQITSFGRNDPVIFDVKGIFPKHTVSARL